jgi:hypothetical protein
VAVQCFVKFSTVKFIENPSAVLEVLIAYKAGRTGRTSSAVPRFANASENGRNGKQHGEQRIPERLDAMCDKQSTFLRMCGDSVKYEVCSESSRN